MIKLEILNLNSDELKIFKKDMQEAFQKGAESEFENLDFEILPEEDINKSLETKGAIAYKAVMNNEIVGGAIVIDELTQHNHLDFLYVKYGIQGKGIGKFIKCVRTLVALAVRGSVGVKLKRNILTQKFGKQ